MLKKIHLLFFVILTIGLQGQVSLSDTNSFLRVTGTSNLHDWEVEANIKEVQLYNVTFKKGLLQRIELKIPITSLEATKKRMQKKMRFALKEESFPYLTVTMDDCIVKNDSLYCANALYTIAGKKKYIPFISNYTVNDQYITLSGMQDIGMKEFDIDPPAAMFGVINAGNEVLVKFKFYIPLKNKSLEKIK